MQLRGKERAIRALNFEKIARPPMRGGWRENEVLGASERYPHEIRI